MSRDTETDILIVGAGPVGMTTALLLAEAGVDTTLIEERNSTAARSYACGLHPHSLQVFDQLGLLPEVLHRGHRVDTIAFYDGPDRCAEVKLDSLVTKYPFVVGLPQNVLEEILVSAIQRKPRVTLKWHHRLSHLQTQSDRVVATVDKLAGTSLGYIVPHWELVVQDTAAVSARHLVGADGKSSMVRRCLGIDYERAGEPELFAVFEFETEGTPLTEVRVVLEEHSTNVFWPLPGGRCRWSFQLDHAEAVEEFRSKTPRAVSFEDPAADRLIQERFQRLVAQRAPWFTATVRKFDWIGCVQFERRLAKQLGDGRTWLIGDAAHQTGPVGMQSLNLGLREAGELATDLASLVRAGVTDTAASSWNYYEGKKYAMPKEHEDPAEGFAEWNQRCRGRWQRLLGLSGALNSATSAETWASARAQRILPCLPASGDELNGCLSQLGLV